MLSWGIWNQGCLVGGVYVHNENAINDNLESLDDFPMAFVWIESIQVMADLHFQELKGRFLSKPSTWLDRQVEKFFIGQLKLENFCSISEC